MDVVAFFTNTSNVAGGLPVFFKGNESSGSYSPFKRSSDSYNAKRKWLTNVSVGGVSGNTCVVENEYGAYVSFISPGFGVSETTPSECVGKSCYGFPNGVLTKYGEVRNDSLNEIDVSASGGGSVSYSSDPFAGIYKDGTNDYFWSPESNRYPLTIKAVDGDEYAFSRWSDGVKDKERRIFYSYGDIHLVAYFSAKYSVKFTSNDGTTTTSTQSGIVTESNAKLNANTFTRNGYTFAGWSLSASATTPDFADKSSADAVFEAAGASAGDTITIYAVWVSIKLRKRGTGADLTTNIFRVGAIHVREVGGSEIELVRVRETVAEGDRYAWIFGPKPNKSYEITCSMGGDEDQGQDKFWTYDGITSTSTSLVQPGGTIKIGASLANHIVQLNFTRKATYTVGTQVRSSASGDIPPVTFKVTTPPKPDVTQLGGVGRYVVGQKILATATYATGAMGWAIYAARLARYNDAGAIISEDALVNQHVNSDGYGTITVNPNQFDSNIVIIGIFDRVKCPLSASVHAASAHAFSAFTATYIDEQGDERSAVSSSGVVKYGEQVKLHVELADGGFQFEGLYVNGTKSALAPDENGDILYTLKDALSFAFVVKAKVSVSMKIVHWADGAKTTGDCKVVLGGTASTGENPVVKDVTLGDTISYGIDLVERIEGVDWLFDAFYNAVSGEQSYTDPIALPISNDAFAPTAPVDVVARVIDEYILYKTTISFVNEETQGEITAQTDFVESPQEADGKFVNEDNELEFDYQRGAMSVTLNFKETLPGTQLLFTKVQQWLYDEQSGEYGWVDVYNEQSVGFLSNANRKLRALYGSAGNRTVSLAYANGSDRTMGDFFIAEADGNGKTIEAPRGSQLTLRAVPANGYRFAGWYYSPQAIERIYESTEQVVTVKTTRTLYALFVQDTHAVYEWEGRSENKMMMWRSKVYVAQIPFNPSAIRVDATDSRGRGMAVNRVEVGMMSSPDAAPAQSGLTVLNNMPNYVARRLPKRRQERYLYVEVQNDAEVDRIIVGTSMEGLRV